MHETASVFVLGSFVVACSAKVPRLPVPGESLEAEVFTCEAGGKGLNLAVGARRLGAAVDGVVAVGDDLFGHLAEPALARAGLPSTMLRRYHASTGSGIGFTDARGENCLAVYPGANLLLSAADIRSAEPALRRAGLVMAQFEIGDEPIAEAFALARQAGVPTLLNPSPFRDVAPGILECTSLLVLNRVEATRLAAALGLGAGCSAEGLAQVAASLLQRGPDTVIVTLGAGGALAYRRGAETLRQPAFPVEAADTLGAGDAFAAGLAVSLVEGRSLAESLRRAAACGAMVTRHVGVFDALPTRDGLDSFLACAAPH